MAKSTFHEILMAKLEENSSPGAECSAPKAASPALDWSFTWQAPPSIDPTHDYHRAYPRPCRSRVSREVKNPTSTPPPPQEPVVDLNLLSCRERTAARRLIEWGAIELTTGISESRLKCAYRRLAKRFHPDRPGGSALLFRELKSHYETLKRALLNLND